MIFLTEAKAKSSYVITAAFEDETGAQVSPTDVVWSLYDGHRLPVNGREQVAVTTPASEVTVVLSGDDLSAGGGSKEDRTRYFVIQATYTTTIAGVTYQDLPISEQIAFVITDIVGI